MRKKRIPPPEKSGGTPCPNCETFIPIKIEDLLAARPFVCPNPDCGTVLNLHRSRSRRSLVSLKRYQEDMDRARGGRR